MPRIPSIRRAFALAGAAALLSACADSTSPIAPEPPAPVLAKGANGNGGGGGSGGGGNTGRLFFSSFRDEDGTTFGGGHTLLKWTAFWPTWTK